MKKMLIICCILIFIGCDFIETVRNDFPDWDSIINASESQKGWFPPIFITDLSFHNKIYNVVIINDPSRVDIWGKFSFLDNILDDLNIHAIPYIHNVAMNSRDRRIMRRMGFIEENIDLYFTEKHEIHNMIMVWHYLIDVNNEVIFFISYRSHRSR